MVLCSQAHGAPIVLDFDSLTDSEIVTTQFPGLTFQNTIALTAGITLNEFEFPPQSGFNVVSDNGGPIEILFAVPILSFSGYFTYLTQLTLTGFAGGNQVDQAVSAFNNNLSLSGDPGSSPNELLQIAFASGIDQVVVSGDPLGGSFTMDDLTISPVPEPGSVLLFLTGVGGLLLNLRRNQPP